MGDASVPHADGVYAAYSANGHGQRIDGDIVITEAIRAYHPRQHITIVDPSDCDFLEYAAAGLATVQLLSRDDDNLRERDYRAPRTRMENGLGKLRDVVNFGHYDIKWRGKTWEFYVGKWVVLHNTYRNYFILSNDELDARGNSPATDALILAVGKWTSELHEEIYVFDNGSWLKNKKLWREVQSATWDDVIIDPAMKETIIADVHSFFDSQDLFQEFGVPWKRGLIFHGIPGCGKTISIKALMNSLGKRTPEVASLYVKSFDACDGAKSSIRRIFHKARAMAPCLLILEDLDSLVVDKLRSYFLNEVDGLEPNDGILMVGSTNHLERLDPAIAKRPSRFDRKYWYRLPGRAERIRYCEYWQKKLERNRSVDFDPQICEVVADMTEGFSFAYLKELFVQTLLSIVGARGNEDEFAIVISTEDSRADATDLEEVTVTAADGAVRHMPHVKIPDRLKDNELLRILRKQYTVLWKDMDTSGNTAEPAAKVSVPDSGGYYSDDD